MDLNKNDAAARSDSINAPAGTPGAIEIDLYDALIAFAEMPPEQQARPADAPEKPSAEPAAESEVEAEEHPYSVLEPVLAHSPGEPVETACAAAEIETAAFVEAAEQFAPNMTRPPIEPVETDATAGRPPFSEVEISSAYVEPEAVRPPPVEGPGPSGPLSGFNLPSNMVYTGALSRGVCLACGAESGADDLFCLSCGVFIDEIGSTLPANPACEECKRQIAADEIFCPWCGAVPLA